MNIYVLLAVGILFYLMIGAGVSKACCDAEEVEPDEIYSSNKRLLWLSTILFWPYELGCAIGNASIYFSGKLANQRYFRNQPSLEITVPAILSQLGEIQDKLKNIAPESTK